MLCTVYCLWKGRPDMCMQACCSSPIVACLLCKQTHSVWVIKPWFSFIFGRSKQLRRVACVRAINHHWRWGNKARMGRDRTTETAQAPTSNTADDSSSWLSVHTAVVCTCCTTCWEVAFLLEISYCYAKLVYSHGLNLIQIIKEDSDWKLLILHMAVEI